MDSTLRRGAMLAAMAAVAALLLWCTLPGGQVVVLNGRATTGDACIGACFPDPGSSPVDCTVQNQVETLPVESFDNYSTATGLAAQGFYTYTDGTASLFFTDYNGAPVTTTATVAAGFEPPVARPSAMPPIGTCKPGPDGGFLPGILHMYGGPFLGWGGGAGISMAKLNGSDPERNFANQQPSPNADPSAPKAFCCVNSASPCVTTSNTEFAAVCPPATAEFAVSIAALDVSQYEGVSFWARRGPNGQAGLRVMVGDKYTDDDLNYLAQREQAATGQPQPTYCSRNRECACTNHQACAPVLAAALQDAGNILPPQTSFPPDTVVSMCGVPTELDLASSCGNGDFACVGLNGGPSSCCELTNCNQPYPAYPCDALPEAGLFVDAGGASGDPQFFHRPCSPYAWTNGIGSSYCFNPASDPPPAPPTEICGDFWMSTVTLDTDWKFYEVPFAALHQQGFGKKAEQFDLHAASVVRFSWDIGWIDYWIDQVSFYRPK
jgi:hypothetical protein